MKADYGNGVSASGPATNPGIEVQGGSFGGDMTCDPANYVIAIVDDEVPVRAALSRLVRSCGYEVVTYVSGADFLRSLDLSHPDCVLLDLHMPVVSGFDVLQSLREKSLDMPVIVVTGNCGDNIPGQVKTLGAMACIDKPVDAEALLESIGAALNHRVSS